MEEYDAIDKCDSVSFLFGDMGIMQRKYDEKKSYSQQLSVVFRLVYNEDQVE